MIDQHRDGGNRTRSSIQARAGIQGHNQSQKQNDARIWQMVKSRAICSGLDKGIDSASGLSKGHVDSRCSIFERYLRSLREGFLLQAHSYLGYQADGTHRSQVHPTGIPDWLAGCYIPCPVLFSSRVIDFFAVWRETEQLACLPVRCISLCLFALAYHTYRRFQQAEPIAANYDPLSKDFQPPKEYLKKPQKIQDPSKARTIVSEHEAPVYYIAGTCNCAFEEL